MKTKEEIIARLEHLREKLKSAEGYRTVAFAMLAAKIEELEWVLRYEKDY